MSRCIPLSFILCSIVLAECATFAPTTTLNDGRQMPMLALGTWLGRTSLHSNVSGMRRVVEWGIDAGYRHIEVGFGNKVKVQVGLGLANKIAEGVKREDLFITGKLFNTYHSEEKVVLALLETLKLLKLDYVDLYLMHWPQGQFNSAHIYLGAWRGMMAARRQGLARSIGLSNFNRQHIDRILAHQLEMPAVLYAEVNLNRQQRPLVSYCVSRGITVAGYGPFRLYQWPAGVIQALNAVASRYAKTLPQLVLRYLFEIGIVTIPKSLTKARVEENIDIFDFQLQEEDKIFLRSFDRNGFFPHQTPHQRRTHPFDPQETPRQYADYKENDSMIMEL